MHTAPTTRSNGSVTVCPYSSARPIQTVIVRADTGSSAATFAVRKGTTEVQVNGPGTMTQSQTQAYASHS